MNLNYRYCARVLIEAETPLKIGTGEPGINIDELVATDCNALPIIPGTALTGVLRHLFEQEDAKKLFGYQENKIGEGSRLILSNANFIGEKGQVIDGLAIIDFTKGFYSKFKKMAIRDHTRITHRGVADKKKYGKFDTQVVFKGCRFVFDMELKGIEEDEKEWKSIINKLSSPLFRVGSGTRKGFGELKIIRIDQQIYNLEDSAEDYLNRSSKLIVPFNGKKLNIDKTDNLIEYKLNLKPDNFFIFSTGYGDVDTDAIAKTEEYVKWENGKPEFGEAKILIPATSVKGAISHRTAWHYNKLEKKFADQIDNIENYTGENNEAVQALFGYAKDSDKGEDHGQRGRTFLSDVFIQKHEEKIFNHVAIDRFTGGAMDGALFDEKVTYTKEKILLKILVEKKAFHKNENIQKAFESTLKDITNGMLPLGGSVMRGHGCFNGTITKDGDDLK